MGFVLSMNLFLGKKGFWQKKSLNFFYILFYILEDFFLFGGFELFRLGLLVHSCCNTLQEEDRREGGKLRW